MDNGWVAKSESNIPNFDHRGLKIADYNTTVKPINSGSSTRWENLSICNRQCRGTANAKKKMLWINVSSFELFDLLLKTSILNGRVHTLKHGGALEAAKALRPERSLFRPDQKP